MDGEGRRCKGWVPKARIGSVADCFKESAAEP